MKTTKEFINWIFADRMRNILLFGITALSGMGAVLTMLYLQTP